MGVLSTFLLFIGSSRLGVDFLSGGFQLLFAVAPLPAAADWLTQSLGSRESWNRLRLVSGLLLGMAFADALLLLLTANWILFSAAVLVFSLYVASIAIVLSITGGWRMVLNEHFPELEIPPSQ